MSTRINQNWLYDIHIKHLVENEDITEILEASTREIITICGRKGVMEEEVPLDDDGFFKPSAVIELAVLCAYTKILPAFWGGGMGDSTQDIYERKLQYYEMKLKTAINDLTKNQIILEQPTEIDYIRQIACF